MVPNRIVTVPYFCDLWAAYHRLPFGQAAESLATTFASHLTSPEKSATENKAATEKRNP